LLSNALKFTPEGGAVGLRARAEPGGFIAVSVSDTGIGIQPDEFHRLFQRFARLDAARAQHIPGSGLGLAISRTLTELQGGTISVESVVGRGTTFTVLLPRHALLLSPSTALPNQP
jgi:two-component system sensor histidine kinase VicK